MLPSSHVLENKGKTSEKARRGVGPREQEVGRGIDGLPRLSEQLSGRDEQPRIPGRILPS